MKTIAQISFLILITSFSYGQDLTGQWNSDLKVQGNTYRLIFHFARNGERYSATLDSPDQNSYGIPVASVTVSLPNVKLEMPNIGMVFDGALSNNKIAGKWKQAGQEFDLIFSKKDHVNESK